MSPKLFLTGWYALRYVLSGGGVAPFMEQMVCEVMESGDQRVFLSKLLPLYQRGLKALTETLEQHREETGWEVESPQPGSAGESVGGFFLWLRLPSPLVARDVVATAEAEHGVSAMVGERTSPTAAAGELVKDRLRLCFAYLDEADLIEGAHRLAAAVVSERRKASGSSAL